jgi:ribosomal protein S18 acetylase RimI-like enzyme
MDIIIRSGTKDDAYGITKLYFEGTGRVLSRPNLRIDLEDYPSAVAELNSEIVGFAYLCTFSYGIVRLDNLYVRSDLRSQGLGQKIIEHLENHMPLEHQYMILDNSLKYEYPNGTIKKSARKFYERLGFKTIVLIQNENGEDVTSVFVKKIHETKTKHEE